jgi:6-phosphogluconolactonase
MIPPMAPERIVTENPDALAQRAAAWIAEAVRETVTRRGHCAIALAGGSTPAPVYRRLAETPELPWQHVLVFFGDERAVPPDDARSNFRLVNDNLLSRLAQPPARVHRMHAERADREAAAREYAAVLPDPLDLLLLGIGEDGHVASLFPHQPPLYETARRVVTTIGGVPLLARLTITPPVIQRARLLCVLAAGPGKATAVARALEGPDAIASVPAQLARRGTWILDRAAAAGLSGAPV